MFRAMAFSSVTALAALAVFSLLIYGASADTCKRRTLLGKVKFSCPEPGQPINYVKCCGDDDNEMCCPSAIGSLIPNVGIVAAGQTCKRKNFLVKIRFTCPEPGDPANYLYCCGDDDNERCCPANFIATNFVGKVIGWILGVVACAIIALILCCCLCPFCWYHKRKHRDVVVYEAPPVPYTSNGQSVVMMSQGSYEPQPVMNQEYPPQPGYPPAPGFGMQPGYPPPQGYAPQYPPQYPPQYQPQYQGQNPPPYQPQYQPPY